MSRWVKRLTVFVNGICNDLRIIESTAVTKACFALL